MPRRATSTGPWTLAVLALLLVAAPLGLLLTGGPAGAAAQALPRAPEAEADGRAKKLPTCATVSVISGERGTCKVKKDGKVLIIKDPLVADSKDGEEESSALGPIRFVKQFIKTYSDPFVDDPSQLEVVYIEVKIGEDLSSSNPNAVRIVAAGGGNFRSSNQKKLVLKAAPSDREALAALDPAAGPCVLEFRTPCGEDGESGRCPDCEGIICPGGAPFSPECAECISGFVQLNGCVCCCSRATANSDCQYY